jgi:hypothetical protein
MDTKPSNNLQCTSNRQRYFRLRPGEGWTANDSGHNSYKCRSHHCALALARSSQRKEWTTPDQTARVLTCRRQAASPLVTRIVLRRLDEVSYGLGTWVAVARVETRRAGSPFEMRQLRHLFDAASLPRSIMRLSIRLTSKRLVSCRERRAGVS